MLTALSSWLLATGQATAVIGAGGSSDAPTRSSARRLTTRSSVLEAAGSRYAPTANAALFDPDPGSAFIGKPCEVSAVRALSLTGASTVAPAPVLLSFFCAGVPSQKATDGLISELGLLPGEVRGLRYRGQAGRTVHGRGLRGHHGQRIV